MNDMNHDRAVSRLTEGGFSTDQSERLLSVIEEVVTARALTKQDLELAMLAQRGELNDKFGDLRTEMNTKIGDLRADMNAGFANIRAEMSSAIGDQRADLSDRISGVEVRLSRDLRMQTLYLLGGMSAIVGLMLTLQKLL